MEPEHVRILHNYLVEKPCSMLEAAISATKWLQIPHILSLVYYNVVLTPRSCLVNQNRHSQRDLESAAFPRLAVAATVSKKTWSNTCIHCSKFFDAPLVELPSRTERCHSTPQVEH